MALLQLIKPRKIQGSIGNVMQIFASNIFMLGINVLNGIMIARFLGPEGRGEQAAIIMWPQFLAYCLTLGIPSALVYYMKKKGEDQGTYYITALYMSVILGSVAMVIGAVLIPFWMKDYSQNVIDFAAWALVMTPIAMIGTVNTAALQAREEFTLYSISRYFPLVGTMLLLCGLIITGHFTPIFSSVAYLLPVLPVAVWITFKLVSQYKVSQRNKLKSSRKILSYGIRSYGTDVAGTFSGYIDQILVVGLLSPASLGLYVVSLNLSKIVNMIQNAITSVLFPKASGLEQSEAIQLTFKVYRISTLVTIFVGIGVFIVAPYLLILLYGKSFADAIPVFRILIFQTAIASLSWILSQGFMSTGKPGIVTVIRVLTLGLNIALMRVLIPILEIKGAAISLLITCVVEFLAIFLIYMVKHNIKLKDFFVSKNDVIWLFKLVRGRRKISEMKV